MRIIVTDHTGHPFQVQLSRALAGHGHEVLHLFAAYFQSPKGDLARGPADPPGFDIEGMTLSRPFPKYTLVRRARVEIAYGKWVERKMQEFGADVVLSSNMPLDGQATLQRACERRGVPLIFWLQDIYSTAIDNALRSRLGALGRLIAARYKRLEASLLRRAAHIVAITEDFRPPLHRWGVPDQSITVIENWAPLADLPTRPQDNSWSRAHGLAGKRVYLYAGTLGLKHNPQLLLSLAERMQGRADTKLVVVSEGLGADWLDARRAPVADVLEILPYQPFAAMPDMLGSAEGLIVILEPEAGAFSVPSKVLSYLCAGRPILGAIPPENLAARNIERIGAGLVAAPGDTEGFLNAAETLYGDPDLRARAGAAGRGYAERNFEIGKIAARFERLMETAVTRTR